MEYGRIKMADGKERMVSRLILGTAAFGGRLSEADSFRLMDRFAEAGGNALDTARVYGENGASEKTVGKWIRSRGIGKEIFLITKGGHPLFSSMHVSRLSREEIRFDMQCSLEALDRTAVDLYFLHRDDEKLSAEGIMDCLHELVQAGYTRALGASNWRAERIREANVYAEKAGKSPFAAAQLQWSYADYAPACQDDTLILMDDQEMSAYKKMPGLAVMAYTSQAEGIFSKGYLPDLSDAAERHKKYVTEENIRRYQQLLEACRVRRITPTQYALHHIIRHPGLPGFALIGASNPEQLEESLKE